MGKINAVITGVGGYVPDYVLTNEELSRMVDTTDEWIMTRVGIKERHILKDKSLGASFLGTKAVEELVKKTKVNPLDVEAVICATSTSDYVFPATAALIANNAGLKNAFAFDVQAACTGFLVALTNATAFIESGRYKKIVVVACEKMSYITDYTDRSTCPLFGDGSGAVLVEATTENIGIIDSVLQSNGAGEPHLKMRAGGSACPASHETVDKKWHTVYQEGQAVFKHAVTDMSDVSVAIMERNQLTADDLAWFIPHQANLRIIDAVAHRMNVGKEKIKINIEKYGNTSAVSIPLCLWEMDNERILHKGDKIVISAFGAGFTWGAMYIIWGYDSK
ncbi:MAG: ketoacyl-ACP synthase III [Prevotellaceae bacterium]|jgi:3-oxoacyl-[acyl-carrier-protein] synthase-3|nr:ketoacyl-ACP synthase III [Prevotellaceae bacterium]